MVVALEPDQERRLISAGEALLIEPVVVGAHVCVDQRANRIKFGAPRGCRKQLVHRFLALTRREAHQQGQRLCTAQRFTSSPLRECRAKNLRAGAFREHLDAKTVEHFIAPNKAEIAGPPPPPVTVMPSRGADGSSGGTAARKRSAYAIAASRNASSWCVVQRCEESCSTNCAGALIQSKFSSAAERRICAKPCSQSFNCSAGKEFRLASSLSSALRSSGNSQSYSSPSRSRLARKLSGNRCSTPI